ncbi:MAG: haloalkane dehalogenase [Promethearchaeota archaeon]
MKLLHTPEARFKNLPDFPFKPNYREVDGIRIHFIDEGPKDSEVILLMHGEPSWSFLYRHMIPILLNAGYRTVAPDLVGFGRSDKPAEQSAHTYRKHVEWITKLVKILDLKNITLFCQDWGSLIGLRVAIENQERFDRIVLSNGGLPTGDQKMSKEFLQWQESSKTRPIFSCGEIVQEATVSELTENEIKAYDAPFPDATFQAGPRIMPSLVPTTKDDPEHENNKKAWELFFQWKKPFLTAFSDRDPITRGANRYWQEKVPGALGQNHTIIKNAGHFVQEDKGFELANLILEFISKNPL